MKCRGTYLDILPKHHFLTQSYFFAVNYCSQKREFYLGFILKIALLIKFLCLVAETPFFLKVYTDNPKILMNEAHVLSAHNANLD